MKIQITILGLGQIGTSMGMALNKYKEKVFRVGHDKSRRAVAFAKENDGIDKSAITLSGAVKDADIVILALPFQEIHDVLNHISEDLKPDTLVVDTSPLKTPVLEWIDQLLPAECHYVGLTPVINTEYLDEIDHGPEVAHQDLFTDTLMGLVTGQNITEKAVDMASNLVKLLGAVPYFCGPAEIDGLMTMTHLMPQVLAAALLKISLDAPGWREAQKFAGKTYSQMTNSFGQDDLPGALAAAVPANSENSARLIDDLVRVLLEIRDASEEELRESFSNLQKERDIWLSDRAKSRWIDTPHTEVKKGNILAQLMGFRGPRKIEDQ